MRFKSGLLVDVRGRYPSNLLAGWRALSEEFFAQIEHGDLVELIVTDRFESVVTQWQRDTPRSFGGEGAVVYRAGKADGTRASAKTVVLAERRAVVVVGADAIGLDGDTARWMLTHEVQHVLLHQQDASAFAVQRRLDKEIESPRPWVFVFTAQSAIDEFRCEKAVHVQRGGREPTYGPADAVRLLRQLQTARSTSRTDLERAYEIVVQVVDRLAIMAAYAGAAVDTGSDDEQRWAEMPEFAALWKHLWLAPQVGAGVEPSEVWALALDMSQALDLVLRGRGVELVFEDDGTSLYFR